MKIEVSTASEYFQQLKKRPDLGNYLCSLIATHPPTFEVAWLDFKSGRVDIHDDNLKKIWSKALGAMANTEGGLLIWGIKADKDPKSKVDAAHALALAPDVNALTTRLKELLPAATAPPVMGVEILPVPAPGPDGFVVCYVPRSRNRPHRSEAVSKRFFIRIQDHSDDVPYPWLKTMFSPDHSPLLEARVEIQLRGDISGLRKFLYVRLQNSGGGTAHDVFVIATGDPQVRLDPEPTTWNPKVSSLGGTAAMAARAIHPGEIYPPLVLSVNWGAPLAVKLELRVFCQHSPAVGGSVLIRAEDIDGSLHIELDQLLND